MDEKSITNQQKFLMEEKGMEILDQISAALQKGKAKDVKELVQTALDTGVPAQQILVEGLLSGMGVVGVKFKNNEVYVPDVLIAARAMKAGTEILKPQLAVDGVKATGKIVLGTVKGDLHDIGKNLVGMMMEGKGLEVIDLGVDVPAEKFVDAAIENDAQVICCSALLTTTRGEMRNVVEAAKAKGVRERFTIMVGGAPVNDAFALSIGADIYTPDAASAAERAVAMVIESKKA
jgi:methylmalonyl-CoA mutase cobalamin-binding domain/chain